MIIMTLCRCHGPAIAAAAVVWRYTRVPPGSVWREIASYAAKHECGGRCRSPTAVRWVQTNTHIFTLARTREYTDVCTYSQPHAHTRTKICTLTHTQLQTIPTLISNYYDKANFNIYEKRDERDTVLSSYYMM